MLPKRQTLQARPTLYCDAGQICLLSFLLLLSILLLNQAFADGGKNDIPGLTLKTKNYEVPDNISTMSTDEVSELRDSRQEELDEAHKAAASKDAVEQNMLDELMRHDLVRLEIIDVIPELIEDYQIEGEFEKTLMGYRSTFSEEVKQKRDNVESLGDYQAYDFRFASVYMSMLFAFQVHPEFYVRIKVELKDDNSSFGAYKKKLDVSYRIVEKARVQLDVVNNVDDLENLVSALNAELARRAN